MKSVYLAILFIALAWPGPAHAQDDRDNRLQIRGIGGWAVFGDSFIHHSVVGVATDVRLWAGLRAGPEVLYNIGPGKDRDITVLPVMSYDFRRLKRVAPFVSGGFGLISHRDGRRWRNFYSFGLGGGAKIAISERLFVAPEYRLGWEPWMRAMVSVGYRF